MSRQFGIACACLAGSLLVWADSALAESMRCKDRLVSLGQHGYEVSSLCGPPDAVEQRVERRFVRRRVRVPCGQYAWCDTEINDAVEVPIEVWTYDFGPQRLMQYVTFEQGTVVRIESGKYGHKQAE
jgi:hypothetical protein